MKDRYLPQKTFLVLFKNQNQENSCFHGAEKRPLWRRKNFKRKWRKMKGIKICPHHMLNAFYISYFIWKIKPTLYYCIVSSLSSSHFSLWVNYQDTNFVMDFWPDPVGELFLVWVRGQQTVVSWANQVCHLFLYSCDLKLFCMFEKVQRIIFHRMWELCQVPESISTVPKLLECSSIRLFLDSLWRLEWQGGVITQTVWPAKPKMFTIWTLAENLQTPI